MQQVHGLIETLSAVAQLGQLVMGLGMSAANGTLHATTSIAAPRRRGMPGGTSDGSVARKSHRPPVIAPRITTSLGMPVPRMYSPKPSSANAK